MITILSIDDNLSNLQTLESCIASNFDYAILNASSAVEAFNVLGTHTVHLIICDIQMPNINGFEFAQMLKLKKKFQDIPLIFLTAYAGIEDFSAKAYNLGAVDYLTKPINEQKLVNKIKGYLRPLELERQMNLMRKKLIDSTTDGIVIIDKEQNILYSNEMGKAIFPHCLDVAACSKPCTNIENQDSLSSHGIELMIDEQCYLCSQVVLPDNTMKLQWRDITFQKGQEIQLLSQNKFSAMDETLSSIAHQWRQPLNIVSMTLGNLEDNFELGTLDALTMEKLLGQCKKQINFMSRTIDDFRDFLKPNGQQQEIFCPRLAVEGIIKLITPELSIKDISIALTCTSSNETCANCRHIFGSKGAFWQVALNIINNAKDAISQHRSDGKGHISVDITCTHVTHIVISDNGGGIKLENISKIFQPYFSTKGPKMGSGIGLYMSKNILKKQLNGEIEVKNIENGAQFKIVIPHIEN